MSRKASNSKHLDTVATGLAQEGWAILGVPLRPTMKRDVQVIARQTGLRPAQWARQVIADAVARAKAA